MIKIKTDNFLKISQNIEAKIRRLENAFNSVVKNYNAFLNTLKGKMPNSKEEKVDQLGIILGGVKFKFWKCAKDEAIKNIQSSIKNKKPLSSSDENLIEEMAKLFELYDQEAVSKSAESKDLAWKSQDVNPLCGIDYIRKNPALYSAISNFGK